MRFPDERAGTDSTMLAHVSATLARTRAARGLAAPVANAGRPTVESTASNERDYVPTWLWIIIIIVVVLAALGYFRRGRT
jgi:hypothetical protein